MQRTLKGVGLGLVGVSAASLVAGAAGASCPTTENAYLTTADGCSWGGSNKPAGANVTALTFVGNDPQCTGYVEVKEATNGSLYTLTGYGAVQESKPCGNQFKYSDHNAQATTGTLWGFRLYGI